MKKIKDKLYNVYEILKNTIDKYPASIITILIVTVIYAISIDNNFISVKTMNNIFIWSIIFFSGTFLTETLIEDKWKKKTIIYLISSIIAGILTYLINIKTTVFGIQNNIFNFRISLIIICYVVSLIILSIFYNYKKSGKKVGQYMTNVCINMEKTTLIYLLLAVGIAIVSAVFIYLILNGKSYDFILRIEVLLFGVYYIPRMIHSIYDTENEVGKFSKIVIKYVLGTLVIIAFAIIYLYIAKIIILRDIPSNQIFRILAALFIIGLPIWTMEGAFDEAKAIDKINKKLPILFTPFIFLQMYAIGTRISANGVTESRYLCIMLIIFEIVYIIMYLKNKEKIQNMLIIFIGILIISTITPGINMYTISNKSQYNNLKIYKQKAQYTQEEKDKIYGAYNYLNSSIDGEKYINKLLNDNEKAEISKFSKYESSYIKKTNYKYGEIDIDKIDIKEYSKMTLIEAYQNTRKAEDVNDFCSNIKFYKKQNNSIYGNDYVLEINLTKQIKQYLENADDMNNYLLRNHEIEIDSNKKIIIYGVSMSYEENTDKINSYKISAYLLEK